jgi:hypothetical protein
MNEARIQQLKQYYTPESFAYLDRTHPEYMVCIDYEWERVGGGRQIKYAHWNVNGIESLPQEQFGDLIKWAKITQQLFIKYKDMSLFEILTTLSNPQRG